MTTDKQSAEPMTPESYTALVPATKGIFALVDIEDLPRVLKYSWRASFSRNGKFYIETSLKRVNGKQPKLKLHQLILGVKEGFVIDHINGDTSDNRRCNLRHATMSENQSNQIRRKHNSSKYRGVYWKKSQKKWVASIRHLNKRYHIGYFSSEAEAALAFNAVAKEMKGPYVCLNVV